MSKWAEYRALREKYRSAFRTQIRKDRYLVRLAMYIELFACVFLDVHSWWALDFAVFDDPNSSRGVDMSGYAVQYSKWCQCCGKPIDWQRSRWYGHRSLTANK